MSDIYGGCVIAARYCDKCGALFHYSVCDIHDKPGMLLPKLCSKCREEEDKPLLFTFYWACQQMKEGRRVKRLGWSGHYSVRNDGANNYFTMTDHKRETIVDYYPTIHDVYACDWMLFSDDAWREPQPLKNMAELW